MAADRAMGLITAWRLEEPTTEMAEKGTAPYRFRHGRVGGSSGRRDQKCNGDGLGGQFLGHEAFGPSEGGRAPRQQPQDRPNAEGRPVAGDERVEATATAREEG